MPGRLHISWQDDETLRLDIVPAGTVPSFLPGSNDVVQECATEYGIPLEASLGGEDTLYPECIQTMKSMSIAPRTTTDHSRRAP